MLSYLSRTFLIITNLRSGFLQLNFSYSIMLDNDTVGHKAIPQYNAC